MLTRVVLLGSLLWLVAGAQQPARPSASSENLRITGTVVDALNGKPLAHARVGITLINGGNRRTVITGADGRFLFQELARGKYVLMAEKAGYPRQAFEGHESYYTSIAAGPGLHSEELVFRMQPESSISGTITNERDEPVIGAEVLLSPAGPFFRKQAELLSETTDRRGYYAFDHLSPGTYRLAVSGKPWFSQCQRQRVVIISSRNIEGALGLRAVEPNSTTGDEPADEQEAPEAGAELKRAFPLTFYPQTTDAAAATPIVLSTGRQFVADMQLNDVPAFGLRVVGHAGEAQLDAEIEQQVFDGNNPAIPSSSERDSAQAVHFDCLAPGHYDLHISVSRDGKTRTLHREVDLSADTDIDIAQAPTTVPVSGSIRLSPPASLPSGFRVCIKGGEAEGRYCSLVSASGEFNFGTGVPTGSYEIQTRPLHLFVHRLGVAGARVKLEEGELEIDGDQAVRLSLVAAAERALLNGVVMNKGQPFAGALVLLVPADDENEIMLYAQDQSDSDGTFTLRDLFPGRYILLAIEHGWDVDWSTPAAVKPYLEHGQAITLQGTINHLKVTLQPQQP
jgi:Carboxypeptidase regulatory-like domain